MPPADPIDVFAEVARSLAEQEDLGATLDRIVRLAVETVPGAEFAAVSMIRRRREVETVAATDDVCRRVDEVQYQAGQGPCLSAIWEQEVVRIDDLSGATDRPEFSGRAVALGISTMLCFRMFVEDDTSGAVNLYARRAGAFDEQSERVGHVFAAHAAVAWDHAKQVDGLSEAARTRALIGQAQGILMGQRRITADAAFTHLRSVSQRDNRKLRDVAQDVVDTGQLADR